MKSKNNISKKDISLNKSSNRLPRINNSLITLRSLSQISPSYETSQFINNLNEFSNPQNNQKVLKGDNAFNNFVFQDNFTKKKITYGDLKSEANNRIAQSSNNITRSANSLLEGGNLHSFQFNNVSQNSSIHHNPIQSNSKLNISSIHPRPSNHVIDFQKEVKNSIQQFSDYAVILKSSEQQVKNLVKLQLQKHENEINPKNPNFNHKRLDYVETKKNIFKIERDSLHSLLNDDNFKFDPKLHKMNFVTLCQMSEEDRSQIEAYFKSSLQQDPLIQQQKQQIRDIKSNYHSYSELIPEENENMQQKDVKSLEDTQNQIIDPPKKKKLIVFNDIFDPFKKKVLKSFARKKKNFDIFQDQNTELTFANRIDLIKDNLKENVILKLKQQYGIKYSHLIIPSLNYLSFKDLDLDRNIMIYKYLQDTQETQNNNNSNENINQAQQVVKLPQINQNTQRQNINDEGNKTQFQEQKEIIQNKYIRQYENDYVQEKYLDNDEKKINQLPEGKALKPFYSMTEYKTDDQIIDSQKQILENLKKRFSNKKMSEEQELFCKRLEENDLIEIQFLLNRNPDLINTIDKDGDTILHIACRKCNLTVIRYLLQQGVDPNALNTVNKLFFFKTLNQQPHILQNLKTPLEFCRLIKRDKLVDFFEIYFEDLKKKQNRVKEISNAASPSEIQSQQKKKTSDKQDEIQQNTDQTNSKGVQFSEAAEDNQN